MRLFQLSFFCQPNQKRKGANFSIAHLRPTKAILHYKESPHPLYGCEHLLEPTKYLNFLVYFRCVGCKQTLLSISVL